MVDIQVDLDTLAGLYESPGELAGYGPVIADIARQVTDQQHGSQWRYAVTDPSSGQILHSGVTRRRPTAGQHRFPYSEHGPTTVGNLRPLCRHDHRIRQVAGWTYRPLPGGDNQWTTKLGHCYTTSGRPP